jgi:serine/threonine protein kinase
LEGRTPRFSDDVYSLSCVIYELLAGRHPYERKSALVARESNMQPERIDGLTELQWRTLAAGLQPSRDGRVADVSDLQEAFNTTSPLRALKIPAGQDKRGERASSSRLVGFLLAATLVSAAAMLFLQYAPSKYLDPIRDSELIQKLQSTLFDRANEPAVTAQQLSAQSSAEVETRPDTVAVAPVAPLPSAEDVAEDANDRVAESDDNLDSSNADAYPVLPEERAPAGPSTSASAFELDAAEYFVPESGMALAVQITRQGDVSSAASVEWRTIADSAEPDVDYGDVGRRLLHFAAGDENKTIFIPIVSDAIAERTEYFRIALRQPGDDAAQAQPYAAIVTIIDDDG